jgi:hypothetical protein
LDALIQNYEMILRIPPTPQERSKAMKFESVSPLEDGSLKRSNSIEFGSLAD